MNSTKLNSNTKYKCILCPAEFDNESEMRNHVYEKHSLDEINGYIQLMSQDNLELNNNIILDMEYNREMNRMVKEGMKYFKRGQLDFLEELDESIKNT